MADNVRQQVLTLGVIIRQHIQPFFHQIGAHGHHPRIDLAQQFFLLVRILLLNDPQDIACLVPHNTAVTCRVFNNSGEQAEPGISRRFHKCVQGLIGDQRHVAVEHDDKMGGGNRIDGLQHCVPRPQLLFLHDPARAECLVGCTDLVAFVPLYDIDLITGQAAGAGVYMRQQGSARQSMHYLGQGGAHTLALSGGKDDGAQGHG